MASNIHTDMHSSCQDSDPFGFCEKPYMLPTIFPGNPLSWMSLFKKDLYLISLCEIKHESAPLKLSSLNLTSQDEGFLQKWRDEDDEDYRSLLPFGNSGKSSIFKQTHNDVDQLTEDEFMNKLNNCLGDHRLVWLLIDRYFDSEVFVMTPFLNKVSFVKSVEKLIGNRNSGKITLKLNETSDLAIIGLILIIMKLTSASLYNFEKKLYPYCEATSLDDIQYMIENPTSKDISHLVSKIQNEIEKILMNSTSLEIFEFLLMRACFDVYEPENCDCIKTPASLNISLLLRYGLQCSLHRDPDNYAFEFPAESVDKDLCRRLWWGLVGLDLYQYIMVGNPRLIENSFYDTKYPVLDPSDEFNYLPNKSIHDLITFYTTQMDPILKLILSINPKGSISEVKEQHKKFRDYISSLKNVHEIASSPCDTITARYENVRDYIFLLSSLSLDFMISYHFFLKYNHEELYEESFENLLACLDIFNKIFEASILFIDTQNSKFNFQRIFGSGILVFPKLESSLHRVSILPFTVLSRFCASILLGDGYGQQEISVFDRIFKILNRIVKHNVAVYLKISHVYYHIWIIAKVHGLLMGQLLNTFGAAHSHPDLLKFTGFMKNYRDGDSGFAHYKASHLSHIADILEISAKTCDFVDDPLDNFTIIPLNQDDDKTKRISNVDMVLQNDKKWLDRMLKEFNSNVPRNSRSLGYVDSLPSKRVKVGYNTLKVSSRDGKFNFQGENLENESLAGLPSFESINGMNHSTVSSVCSSTESPAPKNDICGLGLDFDEDINKLLNSNISVSQFDSFLANNNALHESMVSHSLLVQSPGEDNDEGLLI